MESMLVPIRSGKGLVYAWQFSCWLEPPYERRNTGYFKTVLTHVPRMWAEQSGPYYLESRKPGRLIFKPLNRDDDYVLLVLDYG